MMGFAKLFRKFDASNFDIESTLQPLEIVYRPKLNGPLEGVRILDFSRLLPGPLASMFLADMGAEVLKVEDPDNPDYVRDFEPMLGDTSAFYYALNRNKKSLAVNFLNPEGKKIIDHILQSTDILIEQYRPGVMGHFGFGYEQAKAINPKIIYISITGYGQNNSMAQIAGHDLNYIATSGVLSTIGLNKETITIPGVQIADIAGGSYMSINAILAALYQREKTGKGQQIDLSMTNAVLPLVALQFAEQQASGESECTREVSASRRYS
jgi:alpha-methylacyl-CoA racemase